VGQLALVRSRRVTHNAELEELTNAGIQRLTRQRLGDAEVFVRLLAVDVLAHVDQPDFAANGVPGEVNDPVITLGDTLLIRYGPEEPRLEAGCHRWQSGQIGVPSDRPYAKKRDTLAFRMRKRYLRRFHFEIRQVGQVDRHHVAEETVEVRKCQRELTVSHRKLYQPA